MDNIMVIAGELILVLDKGEIMLRPADTLFIRGHVHG
jgi:hypothetical protein